MGLPFHAAPTTQNWISFFPSLTFGAIVPSKILEFTWYRVANKEIQLRLALQSLKLSDLLNIGSNLMESVRF